MNGSTRQRTKKVEPVNKKDAYRIFWMVKGHFNATESCILDCYESYFKRVWYMEEAWLHLEGFEEAYNKLNENNIR